MVSPGADGHCPRCGSAPPHLVTMPKADAPPPLAVRTPPTRLLGGLAVLVAVVVLSVLVFRLGGRLFGGRGGTVQGEVTVDRLGVRVFFPPGWRRAKDGDQEISAGAGAMTLRTAGFYRGGREADPRVGVVLGVLDGPLPIAPGQVVSDLELRRILEAVAVEAARQQRASAQIDPATCEIVQSGARRAGRCPGRVNVNGERTMLVYLWFMERTPTLAFVVSQRSLVETVAEADALVASVELVSPVTAP